MPNRHFYVAQALVPAASALLPTPAFDAMSQPRTGVLVCLGNEIAAALVGRTPRSGCPLGQDALVPPPAPWGQHLVGCQQADGGVGRGPGVRPTIAVETVPGIQTCATWESVRNAG